MNRPFAKPVPVLVLLICILGACGDASGPTRYLPLEPGFQWQYRVVRTTMDGTSHLRHAIHTLAVEPGTGFAGVRETLGGKRLHYVQDERGLLQPDFGRNARSPGQERLVLPAVLQVGTTWQARDRTAVLENSGPPWETLFRIDVPLDLNYRVEATDARVSTAAGGFDGCLLVTGTGFANADVGNYIGHTQIEVNTREWYAPGVGLVKLEREERTAAKALASGAVSMELDYWSGP